MTGTLALDIETVSPEREPTEQAHFRDSTYFELLAVGLGYRPAPGEPIERMVLFREDDSPASELALVEAVCDWFTDRPAETLLTYNGAGFDLLHLRGRAELVGEVVDDRSVRKRVDALLDGDGSDHASLTHVDLMDDVREAWGGRRKLEWVCGELGIDVATTRWADYEHGLDPDEWRSYGARGDPAVLNTDVPAFGDRYLALASVDARETLTFRALRDLLEDYTVADIEPLFSLSDRRPFSV